MQVQNTIKQSKAEQMAEAEAVTPIKCAGLKSGN